MIHFTVGHCDIETTVQALEKFANNTYYRFHKSNRLKHMIISDKRYPNLKITDDIFSLAVWIKTCDGEERIFLDGDVFLNQITIHTITLDGEHFIEETYEDINRVLKELSGIGKGVIYAEAQKSPVRYEKGKVYNYDFLISEMYDSLTEEKKEEHKQLFEVLQESLASKEDSYI